MKALLPVQLAVSAKVLCQIERQILFRVLGIKIEWYSDTSSSSTEGRAFRMRLAENGQAGRVPQTVQAQRQLIAGHAELAVVASNELRDRLFWGDSKTGSLVGPLLRAPSRARGESRKLTY